MNTLTEPFPVWVVAMMSFSTTKSRMRMTHGTEGWWAWSDLTKLGFAHRITTGGAHNYDEFILTDAGLDCMKRYLE